MDRINCFLNFFEIVNYIKFSTVSNSPLISPFIVSITAWYCVICLIGASALYFYNFERGSTKKSFDLLIYNCAFRLYSFVRRCTIKVFLHIVYFFNMET